MIEPDYIGEAVALLGARPLVQSEGEYVAQVKRIAKKLQDYYQAGNFNGRSEFKSEVLYSVNSCLVRDPSLQTLADQIEGME